MNNFASPDLAKIGEALSNPATWLNWTFIIQTLIILLIVFGALIAMDDKTTEKIFSRDRLGRYFVVCGLILLLVFVLPPVWTALSPVMSAPLLIALVIGIAMVVFGLTRRSANVDTRS